MCGSKHNYTPPTPAPSVAAPLTLKTDNKELNASKGFNKAKGKRRLTINKGSSVGTGVNL